MAKKILLFEEYSKKVDAPDVSEETKDEEVVTTEGSDQEKKELDQSIVKAERKTASKSLTENIDRQTVTIQFEVENKKGKDGYYDLADDLEDSTMTALSDLTDGNEVKKATKWLIKHISGLEVID